MPKIVIDRAIPFIEGVLEPFAEVVYLEGGAIGPADVRDADALIVRTRTKCDAALLEGSSVKIIATATIGTDHIDAGYCARAGIFVQNASGCNAGGVANYVFSALYGVASRRTIKLDGASFGIIGVGNVGRRVEQIAKHLGFRVLRCDPPRAEEEGPYGFCSLDELLAESNIVTLHVPLQSDTIGMASDDFFDKMLPGAIFINACRGRVVDESALKRAIPKLGPVIIDTWCNEPYVDRELIDMVQIATPHIAGYSYQGKQNGTAAVVRTVARYFDFKPLFEFYPPTELKELEAVKLDLRGKTQGEIAAILQYNYPIFTDDFLFRMNPEDFETIRTNYQYRREFFVD